LRNCHVRSLDLSSLTLERRVVVNLR
jgi:hypothetical protein